MGGRAEGKRRHQILKAATCLKGRGVFFLFLCESDNSSRNQMHLTAQEGQLCEFSSNLCMSNNAMITKEQKGTQNI